MKKPILAPFYRSLNSWALLGSIAFLLLSQNTIAAPNKRPNLHINIPDSTDIPSQKRRKDSNAALNPLGEAHPSNQHQTNHQHPQVDFSVTSPSGIVRKKTVDQMIEETKDGTLRHKPKRTHDINPANLADPRHHQDNFEAGN